MAARRWAGRRRPAFCALQAQHLDPYREEVA